MSAYEPGENDCSREGIAALELGRYRILDETGTGRIGIGAYHPHQPCVVRIARKAADLELDAFAGAHRQSIGIVDQ